MIVDFHVHSTASDGTYTPGDLVRLAADRGIASLALTDHDNCDGIRDFQTYRSPAALRTFAGIELSIEPGNGFDRFHLLGLGVDPGSGSLAKLLRSILEGRKARNLRITENFRRLGIPMPEDPREEAASEVVARPHYARWLFRNGYAASIAEAFEKYLLPVSPRESRCYEERWHPPQEEAFRAVHEAGGLCVMAHPRYWRNDWPSPDYAVAEHELAVLKEKGLDGLECLYQANTPAENVGFTRIACRLGLLKSAGSDFHGTNKPAIPLGMEVSETFIGPLLDALASR